MEFEGVPGSPDSQDEQTCGVAVAEEGLQLLCMGT